LGPSAPVQGALYCKMHFLFPPFQSDSAIDHQQDQIQIQCPVSNVQCPMGTGFQLPVGTLELITVMLMISGLSLQVVSYICWVPNRRGAVAVACTDPATHTERLARNGRLSNAYILVWNMRDPIHPEYVLESPHEVKAAHS
jgi:hypothetical protein